MTTALIRPSIRPHPLRAALPAPLDPAQPSAADLRMFFTAWLGGLVFFGTLLA
jgi:hypothetical protein